VAQELTTLREGTGFTPVGEKAGVAEADQARRENMEEEAVEEGRGIHGHFLQPISMPTVAIGEADLTIADIDETRIRDGHSMGGAANRVNALGRARKGGFGIHHPRGGVELVEEVGKALGGGQGSGRVAEGERSGRVGLRQGLEKLGAADRPSGLNGEEKRRMRGHPTGVVIGQGASWDQTVHVEVRLEELVPRMEDHHPSQLTTEVVPTELEQRLTGGGKQEAEKQPFMTQDERVERVWQCKDGVQVGHREEGGLAVGHPWRLGEALTLGTVSMAARVVGVALEAALRTLLHVPAKLGRATGRNGLQDPLRA
jgi:hypothetical protein